jgi:hypothetical protein
MTNVESFAAKVAAQRRGFEVPVLASDTEARAVAQAFSDQLRTLPEGERLAFLSSLSELLTELEQHVDGLQASLRQERQALLALERGMAATGAYASGAALSRRPPRKPSGK